MAKFSVSCLVLVVSCWLLLSCGDLTDDLVSLSVSPATKTIGIGKTAVFSAFGKNSVGTIVAVSPTWSVSGGIGTINSSGFFTAEATAGTGEIIATYGSVTGGAAITITANGWLTGKVRSSDGGVASNMSEFVYLANHSSLVSDTDSKGDYLISNIPAGSYEVWTKNVPQYLVSSQEVTIPSGETVSLTITVTINPVFPTIPTTTLPF